MELDYKAIGKRIKIARIKKNLTQEAIADKIGITPQHVSNIETGNASVSLTTLVAIANTLTVSVNDLLCDTVLISKAVFEKEASPFSVMVYSATFVMLSFVLSYNTKDKK